MNKNEKENVSINIQTEIRPGKTTEITAEIQPSKSSQAQSQTFSSSSQQSTQSSGSSGLEKGMAQMNISAQHEKGIPFQDLSGIETFNEAMQIYFRDAYNLSRIFALTMALQLRIFEIFMQCSTSNNSFCSAKDIRTKILSGNSLSNISERHLADLLNELETQGFLESQGTIDNLSYRLSDFTKKFFLQNSPNSIARLYLNINRYMRSFQENMLSNFSMTGAKSLNHAEDNFLDENETNMVIDYFYRTSESSFERLMELIDFTRFKRVVDVRGSYGLLSAKLKKRFPTVEFVSYDNPTLETYAVSRLTALNMINDVLVRSGSVLSGNVPECDCVIAPNLFMHFNNDNCLLALRNVYHCLSKQGGQLIIMENFVDPQMKDCKAITMSFMMGIQNCEGHARTFDEFLALLLSAGFKSADRVMMGPGMCDMIIATK